VRVVTKKEEQKKEPCKKQWKHVIDLVDTNLKIALLVRNQSMPSPQLNVNSPILKNAPTFVLMVITGR